MNRTHNNGELRITDVNKKVELIGWVAKKRNLGALVFVDLRDRHGITQVIFDESFNEDEKDRWDEQQLDDKEWILEILTIIQPLFWLKWDWTPNE